MYGIFNTFDKEHTLFVSEFQAILKEPLKNRGVTAPSQPSTEKFDYSC
jgi:hypothetical protein